MTNGPKFDTSRPIFNSAWQQGNMLFYVPPTIQSNYDNYLATNVPGHTYNATLNGELDLCQYFGQKKLKYYADFFSSSSSLCCGVI